MDVELINNQLDRIEMILNDSLVSTGEANAIYGYRAMPSKLPFVISVSFLGGNPEPATSGGFGRYSDFAIVMEAHHDKTSQTLRWSERQMNKVEGLITNLFQLDNFSADGLWMSTDFFRPSARPPSPTNYPDARLGHLYLRVFH
ncbi:MAG: hypothetical protein IAF02_20070 [Anaerolineae bacterium]|nr:hypothetical protein [Anaerolineae bacterium]